MVMDELKMLNFIIYQTFLFSLCSTFTLPAPKTIGEPWPLPQTYKTTANTHNLQPPNFQFDLLPGSKDCNLLQSSIERCFVNIFGVPRDNVLKFTPKNDHNNINNIYSNDYNRGNVNVLSMLAIHLENDCEEYPSFHMNESCKCDKCYIYIFKLSCP